MKKRGCIIGNSHVAALMGAWGKESDRWDGVDLDFFGMPGGNWWGCTYDGVAIRPKNEAVRDALEGVNGVSAIPLQGYDFFAVIGQKLSVQTAIWSYRSGVYLGLPSVNALSDIQKHARPLRSRACFEQDLRDRLSKTSALHLAKRLSDVTGQKAWVLPQPNLDITVRQDTEGYEGFRYTARMGDGDALMAQFETQLGAVCAEQGLGFVPQPAETRIGGIFTQTKFMQGSHRLTGGGAAHPQRDRLHGNAAYGARVLDAFSGTVLAGSI